MLTKRNSTIQGNVGLGYAIQYFTSQGYIVSIPLNDSQAYDLVVDMGDGPKRVDVKTTRLKDNRRKNSSYIVTIKQHNSSRKLPYDPTTKDYLFILTEDGTQYLIPSDAIWQKTELHLGKNYDRYILPFSSE